MIAKSNVRKSTALSLKVKTDKKQKKHVTDIKSKVKKENILLYLDNLVL